jgi:ligand-binding sensor domain-containing protein
MKRHMIDTPAICLTAAIAALAAAGPMGAQQPNHPASAPGAARARLTPASQAAKPPAMPHYRFENFTTANGLPADHVYSVLVDGDRIWAGTDNGLGLYENGKWKTYTTADGLAHRAVLSLALDKRTGDVWAGTMGGLSRISAGRIVTYTQLNSGLSNDVVYGVSVEGENVWVATAAGACRLNLSTGQWSLYNERNTPMEEIWVYGVSAAADKVYFAVWGSGLLELTQQTGKWDLYIDPDKETEMVLFKDQGLIHNIVSSVSYVDNIVWASTYFGDSRYDGRYWHNFLTKDSGLPSNFTNQAKGVDANRAWFCTDKGKPEMLVRDAQGHQWNVPVATAPAHNYMNAIDFQGDDIWVATARGLSHGIFERPDRAAIR